MAKLGPGTIGDPGSYNSAVQAPALTLPKRGRTTPGRSYGAREELEFDDDLNLDGYRSRLRRVAVSFKRT